MAGRSVLTGSTLTRMPGIIRRHRVCRKSGCATFFEGSGFAYKASLCRAAKPVKYENLSVFIRSAVHAAGAGMKSRATALDNPRFFSAAKGAGHGCPLFLLFPGRKPGNPFASLLSPRHSPCRFHRRANSALPICTQNSSKKSLCHHAITSRP